MKKLLYLFTFVLALGACKKDPPPPDPEPCMENGLPCLTTEGKNMFACLVDGEPWIAKVPISIAGPAALSGEYDANTGWLYLKATLKDDYTYQTISIFGDTVLSLGEQPMFVSGGQQDGFLDYKATNDCEDYRHKEHSIGTLDIQYLDIDDGIISGRFQTILYDLNCPDSSLTLTDGRFDFKF